MSKAAIITGGSSGLGLKAAELLSNSGYKVAIWDRLPPSSTSLKDYLYCEVDVTNSSSITSALDKTLQVYPKLNVLLNSAGIAIAVPIIGKTSTHDIQSFESVMSVNIIGLFDVCRQVCRHLTGGVIINVASIAGTEGSRGQCAYSASKGAVLGLTMPLARDLAPYKIRVVAIAPGHFVTPMGELVAPKYVKMITDAVALKRSGMPEEFAHAVLFAAENTYINGTVIRIDGGLVNPNI